MGDGIRRKKCLFYLKNLFANKKIKNIVVSVFFFLNLSIAFQNKRATNNASAMALNLGPTILNAFDDNEAVPVLHRLVVQHEYT